MAVASLAVTAYSAMQQADAQEEAKQQQQQATAEQRKAQQEQKAAQAAQAAAERRQQIREERVKRARLIQSSANTGVAMSSGEAGASGSLSTQLGSNLGFNTGQLNAAENISGFNQNAADFLSSASNSIQTANQWGQIGALSMNIFDKSGGFGAFKIPTQAPAPVVNRDVTGR